MIIHHGIAGDILDSLEANYNGAIGHWSRKPEYTKKVTITFLRDELLYDIKNMAFVEGDIIHTNDEHDRHQIMDICEDGNIDRVSRILDFAISKCRELLFPFTKTKVEDASVLDDKLEVPDKYEINMLVPDDFSRSSALYLEKLIHEYLVCTVLSDWLSITNLINPTSSINWNVKLKSIEEEIDSILNARIHRVRRTQTPF